MDCMRSSSTCFGHARSSDTILEMHLRSLYDANYRGLVEVLMRISASESQYPWSCSYDLPEVVFLEQEGAGRISQCMQMDFSKSWMTLKLNVDAGFELETQTMGFGNLVQ